MSKRIHSLFGHILKQSIQFCPVLNPSYTYCTLILANLSSYTWIVFHWKKENYSCYLTTK